ncbi:hypothetical protein GGI08_009720 [Coemansia sp. S2]|nr:hypothetical protein GGI08_009720 [Coemansia sp. S2]KAJ2324639.1 hypothetical protein GGH92_010637 [Coemansia sp. RSA 2673]
MIKVLNMAHVAVDAAEAEVGFADTAAAAAGVLAEEVSAGTEIQEAAETLESGTAKPAAGTAGTEQQVPVTPADTARPEAADTEKSEAAAD